ncbi:hypothetical protein [Chryseobacterium koreense]|uniref:Lipoprotein n=1 Tax=Chryseobacterium koreense CCUG 49689 TaxID=1304281 RepID=A0A0J7INL1_9FLAO|nr:hypothetical protein [Chryseobacterium koreense]KMQ67524.1 hypothetical protein ACM44_14770 [Chryseobacterium koreense CCUG 49689]MBB5332633.1 hypothetical protein [Chryseobacterium koreense]
MKNLILIFALATISFACGRSSEDQQDTYNPQLPPITQTGANTFGVKINGVGYTPKSSTNDLSNIGYPVYNGVWIDFSYDNGKTFTPFISLDKKNRTSFFLRINDVQGITTKNYVLNGQDQNNPEGRITLEYLIYESPTLKKAI